MRKWGLSLVAATALGAGSASAMDFHPVGDVLILSGPVTGTDLARWRDHVQPGRFRLVVLHESAGGDLFNGYMLAHRIREDGLATAVSGKCESACGLIFLGGTERSFSDGQPLANTMVALHGAYHAQAGHALSELSPRMAYMIRTYTGGKYPDDLLRRTVYPRHPQDLVYAFHPLRFETGPPRGVMECLRQVGPPEFRCTMLPGLDALGIGVVTEPGILRLPDAVKAVLATLGP